MLSGKTIVLDVEATDTVHKIKAKIQDMEGIPVAEQTPVKGDEKLSLNFNTLGDYNIQQERALSFVVDKTFQLSF